MRNINSTKTEKKYVVSARKVFFKSSVFFLLSFFLLIPGYASTDEEPIKEMFGIELATIKPYLQSNLAV